jgi:hypothetical protein
LLVFVIACLLLAVWLLRSAPPDELRGVQLAASPSQRGS